MSNPGKAFSVRPLRRAERGLLIVARDQGDLYDCLRHAYGDGEAITVLLDRRQGERRRRVQPVAGERRHHERRSPPAITHVLRCQPYVLAYPNSQASRCVAALATRLCRDGGMLVRKEGFFRRVANWFS